MAITLSLYDDSSNYPFDANKKEEGHLEILSATRALNRFINLYLHLSNVIFF